MEECGRAPYKSSLFRAASASSVIAAASTSTGLNSQRAKRAFSANGTVASMPSLVRMPRSTDADIFVAARGRQHEDVLRRLHAGRQRVFDVGRIADVDVVVDHDHHVEVLERAERRHDGVALQAVVRRARSSSPARWRGSGAGRRRSSRRR